MSVAVRNAPLAEEAVELSIVIPVFNEAENVEPLACEIEMALGNALNYEVIFVDDGSTDETAANIRALRSTRPYVRLLRHARRCGQSAALRTGVRAARAAWIATLDGDGQNDPRDLPALLAVQRDDASGKVRLVAGVRRVRHDSWVRRISSRVANAVRCSLLKDGTPDTGCGIKLFHRATFLEIPAFDHMHRFLPALFQREGAAVVSVDVNHRPRRHGCSKYGIGNRLWVGIVDLFGVRWLMKRATHVDATEEPS